MKPTTKKLPGWVHIPLFVFMTISFWETGDLKIYLVQKLLGDFLPQSQCSYMVLPS